MSENTAHRLVGRPSEYDPAFCEQVITLGKQGKSRAQIASALDCSRQTLLNWERAHPEFLDALARAKDEELAWWEQQAQDGLNKGSAFNAAIWGKSVSGRFPNEPYRDRVQLSGPHDGPIEYAALSPTDRKARIDQLIAKAADADDSGGN